jgi:metal-responsive CopG/Arc/MetJ family transcriptional regulator
MSRYTIELNDTIVSNLDDYSKRTGSTRAEAVRRALAVLTAFNSEVKSDSGSSLAIIDHENKVVAKLVGI